MRLTYRSAGVDLNAADEAVKRVRQHARTTFTEGVITDIGAFGGLFALGKYQEPVLVSSVDGVGTKLKIAFALDKHDTVGQDLVNHCVNDILACGAQPLFFLDYFATGTLNPGQLDQVAKGLAVACREAGCALIGGETAEMPGFYSPGEYDIAGSIVGVVERSHIIDGSGIAPGDAVLGLPSSGLHTNGYSLVRRVFGLYGPDARDKLDRYYVELGRTLGEELLEPHRCYLNSLRPLLPLLKGLAHITGGGLPGNVVRILPSDVRIRFHTSRWKIPPIFHLIQHEGQVEEAEMFRVFNMGIGIVLVCAAQDMAEIQRALPEARSIGEVLSRQDADPVVIEVE
ncbi:MAG: phosphoribosylformylglycinamidine cyclo-ligase [Actinobacteria bacterium]|nr:phosphoribosylformylglycinamidine cyclo-ligase [Actinomycetota bacterium]